MSNGNYRHHPYNGHHDRKGGQQEARWELEKRVLESRLRLAENNRSAAENRLVQERRLADQRIKAQHVEAEAKEALLRLDLEDARREADKLRSENRRLLGLPEPSHSEHRRRPPPPPRRHKGNAGVAEVLGAGGPSYVKREAGAVALGSTPLSPPVHKLGSSNSYGVLGGIGHIPEPNYSMPGESLLPILDETDTFKVEDFKFLDMNLQNGNSNGRSRKAVKRKPPGKIDRRALRTRERILGTLKRHGKCVATQIANEMSVHKSNVNRHLSKLKAAGRVQICEWRRAGCTHAPVYEIVPPGQIACHVTKPEGKIRKKIRDQISIRDQKAGILP